jgi:ribosomal protein S18 acetylase RimI-like enzyme
MNGPAGVRRATAADVPELARMLARAFDDDPVAAWAFPSGRLRPAALERFQELRLRQLLQEEEVWTSAELTCAALWAPPGRWQTTLAQDAVFLQCFAHPRLAHRAPIALFGWMALERRHPRTPPHWYLSMLGTDPAHQGRGLGSELLAPVLEGCDRDGVGAFLESSKERNIAFYARHGFRVVEEVRLLRGPPVWKMWRDPQGWPAPADGPGPG